MGVLFGESISGVECAEFVGAWNATTGQRCVVTAKRKRSLAARTSDEWWVANWRRALESIPSSAFLMGDNARGWRANIDWFLRPDTVARIVEGRYHGESKKSTYKGHQFGFLKGESDE